MTTHYKLSHSGHSPFETTADSDVEAEQAARQWARSLAWETSSGGPLTVSILLQRIEPEGVTSWYFPVEVDSSPSGADRRSLNVAAPPMITSLEATPSGLIHFTVESGSETVAEEWRARLRGQPWCRVMISGFDDGNDHLGGYHGEVWPTAWPAWFKSLPPSVAFGSGRIVLTPAGRRALAEALYERTG